ncbi:hypothetical protein C1645_833114 [Glomus cerebriforme]|uniref:Uncharacterized protein n=1 Tax=Glomus cerebriforme TaxID=658196 RepID=A0A397SMR8_9GLOM|nr:hypothetical protein C1645_833114 [Glomus cerebriforme]
MFVEDIITEDNKIKSWQQICKENRRSTKGRISKWYLEAKTILTNNNKDQEKFEREFIKEDIDDISIINRIILKINNMWERFNNIIKSIENELLEKYYNQREVHYKYEVERKKMENNKFQEFCTNLMVKSPEKIFNSFDFTSLSKKSLILVIIIKQERENY